MSFTLGTIFGLVVTGLTLGALVVPGSEDRELVRSLGFLVGFWTILLAILL